MNLLLSKCNTNAAVELSQEQWDLRQKVP